MEIKTFKIPVMVTMMGYVDVEAESEDEAHTLIENGYFNSSQIYNEVYGDLELDYNAIEDEIRTNAFDGVWRSLM